MYDSLSSGVAAKCPSLRKLSLSHVTLNDNMLQTLLNSCPLIVTFNLEYCSVLEKIELLNLQKIKSVSMRMCRYHRVKIKAPTLEHLFLSGFEDEYPMLDIIDAPNLVSLNVLKEAAKMSILSKTWLQAWLTLPDLKFTFD
ncbi:hypothetical protein MTR67_041605 [Solanum verrucosum]|uniref:F-box/LRR-repeat protein 15/At3g58940/PEG3-like LRR domain-containing protein n=1 Tax=Solanum verrucosum TaxID=315347 RepID=A0AAF0UL12_SOLVR|nr:hypothetical protein MTR67_041605 [Solanum verrucosum]